MFIARCQISTWVNAAVTSCHQPPSEKPAWKVAPEASQTSLALDVALLDADGNPGPYHRVEIEVIRTTGDRIQDVPLARIGDRGLFTKEVDCLARESCSKRARADSYPVLMLSYCCRVTASSSNNFS